MSRPSHRRHNVGVAVSGHESGRGPWREQDRHGTGSGWESSWSTDVSQVRVLVGTRKGAFILRSDGARETWSVAGPFFGGWEIYHLKGSPADPDRIYASQSTGWFGQLIQRSNDGGTTWDAVGNQFLYEGVPGTHQWYDGTPHPWEFARVWHLEPSLTDPDTVYAGVEDAALFRSVDGGQEWHELAGLRGHGSGAAWQPGAGGMCLHTIIQDPKDPGRIYVAISAAGAFRTDDGGKTWQPINRGLRSDGIPDEDAEVGHCVHHIAMHPARPHVLFMQKHWDVMRSDDSGESWREISGNLPSDFGFPIAIHAHEPDTIYVVPIKSDGEHYPPDGRLRVYRSRTGGDEWEPLTAGLPQKDCYVNVLRDAMAVDDLDACGIYFGTTGGQVYVSPDAGDHWTAIVRDLPAVVSVEVQTLP
ncbi:MAG: hypothetical protein QOK39_1078 [Acidimicrobiaceae bacterium]|nr:hypothetical protein [Acidimicrobiaceae bacterium]